MRIDDLFGPTYAADVNRRRYKEEEEDSFLKAFGGRDTVTISQAARERQAATVDAGEQKSSSSENDKDSSGNGKDSSAAGSEAAGGAQGGGGVGGSTGDQVEALEKQLKQLTAKYQEVASDESMSPPTKEAQLSAIQAQISEISSQIAELKAQQVKGAA